LEPTRTAAGTPAAEHQIDTALVARLLAAQHRDLARLPLEPLASGWDNAMFRLGADLVVRLPRRAAAAGLILNEQRWLPVLAARLTLAIPVPERVGRPGRGYPWHWSIQRWLPGSTADERPLETAHALHIAAFLRSLHMRAPADAPHNPLRGGPLRERAPIAEARLARIAAQTDLITDRLRQVWAQALETPIDVTPTWIHGDVHPGNVLVHRGRLSGIIDWGDIAAGDPATDLAAAWLLFEDPEGRQAVFDAYGASDATVARARGWAVHLGAAHLDAGLVDNPRHRSIGEQTLRRVAEGE